MIVIWGLYHSRPTGPGMEQALYLHLSSGSVSPTTLLQVVTYEGRIVCSPQAAGMRHELLSSQMASLSPDTLAAMDGPGGSSVRLLDTAQVGPTPCQFGCWMWSHHAQQASRSHVLWKHTIPTVQTRCRHRHHSINPRGDSRGTPSTTASRSGRWRSARCALVPTERALATPRPAALGNVLGLLCLCQPGGSLILDKHPCSTEPC